MLDDALLDTVAVGNSLALAAITLIALANALVESLEVSLIRAGDLDRTALAPAPRVRGTGRHGWHLQERSELGRPHPQGRSRRCTSPARW